MEYVACARRSYILQQVIQSRVSAFDRNLYSVARSWDLLRSSSHDRFAFISPQVAQGDKQLISRGESRLSLLKRQQQSPCLMTFAQPTANICPRRFTAHMTVEYDSTVLFTDGTMRGRTFRDRNNTLFLQSILFFIVPVFITRVIKIVR